MNILNKKMCTIILILVVLIASFLVVTPTYAVETGKIDFGKADQFIKKGKAQEALSSEDLKEIGDDFSEIGHVLVYIGAGIIVGGMSYLGIMYMISTPEKRGKLKQQLIGLAVSAVVVFGAFAIWSILVKLLSSTIDPT